MKKIALFAPIFFLLIFAKFNTMHAQDYQALWKEIEKHESDNLPRSAYKTADKIYTKAAAENNSPQLLKAFIYRMKFKNEFEEDAFESLLSELDSTVKTAQFPESAVMHSMLADMYLMYYQSNRYKFISRTNTVNFDNQDIKTWTLDHLANKVIEEYQHSLARKSELQKIPVKNFELLVNKGDKRELRPTLYDFLAHKALDVFMQTDLALTKPINYFEISEDYYFQSAARFVNNDFKTKDSLSFEYQSIKLLKELLAFRLTKKENTAALIDADLRRLKYVYNHSVNPEKEALYLQSLQNLENQYSDQPAVAEVKYAIASVLFDESEKYSPDKASSETFKSYRKRSHDICKEIIENFPKTEAAKKSKSLIIKIETHYLHVENETVTIPNQAFPLKLKYRNTEKVFVRIASISRSEYEKITDKKYGYEEYDALLKKTSTVQNFSKTLPADPDFNPHSVQLIAEGLPIGFYMIFVSDNEKFSYEKAQTTYSTLTVSGLAYSKQRKPDNSYRFAVYDRKSGQPLQNVRCDIFVSKYSGVLSRYVNEKIQTLTTDADGMFQTTSNIADGNSFTLEFHYKNDFLKSESSYYTYNYSNGEKAKITTKFFTDRAIYRPGQSIHFKGIVLRTKGEHTEIVNTLKQEVLLLDPNYQEVSKLELTSNEFGTFAGSFDIPKNLRNGSFTIKTESGSHQIKVEEYKRPKFETELLPFDGNYLLNDKITVKGKAISYAGSPLTEASVSYRIKRSPRWWAWWSYYFDQQETEIANGAITTNDKGIYEFDFQAVPDRSMKESPYLSFNYSIEIDVTDINGETQSTSGSIQVGYRALKLGIDIRESLNVQNLTKDEKSSKIKVQTTNLNGEFIPAEGQIKVYKLKNPDIIYKPSYWDMPDKHLYTAEEWKEKVAGHLTGNENKPENFEKEKLIFEGKFNTENEKHLDFSFIKNRQTGYYLVEMEANDAFGNPVEHKQFFSLTDYTKTTMPKTEPLFFERIKTICEPGDTAMFLIGSSYKDAKILYQIEHKNKIVKQEYISLGNETRLVEIPITEAHRGNFSVHFTLTRESRFYTKSEVVTVPFSNKQLNVEFSSFRDKLQPGQKEEWRLTVKDHEGQKAVAEMLAGMYDASLDQFVANYWSLNIYPYFYTQLNWTGDMFDSKAGRLLKKDLDDPYYPILGAYDQFNWFGFSYDTYRNVMFYSKSSARPSSAQRSKKSTEIIEVVDDAVAEENEELADFDRELERDDASIFPKNGEKTSQDKATGDIDSGKDDFGDVKIRTNFNETAFFYPHLKTNEQGEIVISFTVPESLTRWKLMTLSHTKDLEYSADTREIITQKDLMILPNSPRFFRENDKISFPVKISSLSKKELSGNARLEFFDPLTDEPVKGLVAKGEKATKPFTVKSEGNINISWNLEIPEGLGAVAYRVVAKADDFSDGEQKALPVLTNRMLVTESLPLPVKGNSKKEFTFEKLVNSVGSSTLRHHKLTLEFTSNPAWYAVQALPYIMEYPYECSEQIFSRLYANSLASHIAQSDPKIKKVFDSWKNEDPSALLSNLQKNEELKSVLLQETPWVAEGKNEAERKQRIGLLFDINRMQYEQEQSIQKLAKNQYANGGWPWFAGMPESRYITQHIVTGMGHLKKLGVISYSNTEIKNMLYKAISYLDSEIKKEYDNLKRHYDKSEMENDHLSYMAVHYLYGRSFFPENQIPSGSQKAVEYFTGQAKKYWTKRNLYSQGMLALALHRGEDTETAKKIAASIKEHSTVHDELGRYWKNNTGGWYWYQAPIETQSLMVEVFTEVVDEAETVEELKIWLLKQKQTQDWKTTKATANAIYALLLQGTDLLASDAITEVYLNNRLIDPNKIEGIRPQAGTGYFKTSWSGNDISPKMGHVKLIKKDKGIAWGALYWQYFEQLDKITPHETPLSLKKQLFVERITDGGAVIEPVTESNLKVGDKVIVRIELRSDRRMEYIHLKDMRASGFEPINVFSRYKYQDGLGYYESTKDASTNFFMEHLPKGTFVFEYPLRVAHEGDFSNGITTIQCMYAPEFSSHSQGVRVKVTD